MSVYLSNVTLARATVDQAASALLDINEEIVVKIYQSPSCSLRAQAVVGDDFHAAQELSRLNANPTSATMIKLHVYAFNLFQMISLHSEYAYWTDRQRRMVRYTTVSTALVARSGQPSRIGRAVVQWCAEYEVAIIFEVFEYSISYAFDLPCDEC
ncbi:uncharacterized protein LAESUDRAFT_714687 [Laetiporus sulphureus 93-53]|uniref:Uncharacterized protein n=1 Tax=Laetiporus sulphureus 93-53 TaxID=1314785 RepID=A0A165DUV9_9APHY|nr:uncharacterized protein LAESUDRAFT_714687 [Laetiporus sulphureus 93-53]KZT05671.1 hypothetical protein LAESUDRAFT_714687 [Laetiporus sulphureus 93-53]